MTLVSGASQYLSQTTLENVSGTSGLATTNVLETSGATTASLLDLARVNAVKGVGLSANARLLNKQLLEQTANGFNQLFSLGATIGDTDSITTKILAIRSSLPEEQIVESLRGTVVDEEA